MIKKLDNGFKLFQPWASDVVKGKLKYLVRSIPTVKRKRVAVIASSGIDCIWMQNADIKDIESIENKVGAIGSVEIKDCVTVKTNNVEDQLIKLAGRDYWRYYPKHLIPNEKRVKNSYIWILDKAKEWDKVKAISGGGIIWVKRDLEDE